MKQHRAIPRKKFVFWIMSALSVFTAAGYFLRSGTTKSPTKIKMLTQDGSLVEVEISKLSKKRKKIKDDEVYGWVKRKSSL